jgi:hypothetical protein
LHCRAVGRSENLGVLVLFGGHNLPPPPLVEIGSTDLPKYEAPPAPLGTTPLNDRICDTMCRMKWPENTCEKFILLSHCTAMPLATNSCLFQVGKLARPHKQFSTGIVAASSR